MKTKIFSSILLLCVAFTTFISCESDESTAAPEPFFNLNVGNHWVYKRYDYHVDAPNVYTYSGITDNVSVTDIENLNGFNFSHLIHEVVADGNESNPVYYDAYLRINNAGNLVGYSEMYALNLPDDLTTITDDSGTLFHPGNNPGFQNTVSNGLFGSTNFNLLPQTTMTVEGNSYDVWPYFGEFTLSGLTEPTRTLEMDYAQQIGPIRTQTVEAQGNNGFEYRLVSYSIVP